MPPASDIDGLIAGLYRAAAGERPWADALHAIVRALRCWGVQVLGMQHDGRMTFSHDAGFPAEGMLHYLSRYHRVDPRTPLLARLPVGRWWHCHEHFDDAFVARHPLYQELLIPYGGRYSSGVKLQEDDQQLVMLAVGRGREAGPLDAEERTQFERLAWHLQTALGLWQRQQVVQQQALAGAAIVSRLAQPVLVVDAQLRIHHLNAAAQALIGRHAGVAERRGRLACSAAAAQAELLVALQQLNLGAPTAAPTAAPAAAPSRSLVRSDRGGGLLMVLMPLQPHETLAAFGPQPLALMLLHDLAQRRTPDPLLVATAFELTPAEAQVACRVAAGLGPQAVARASGVSVHTVRAQLAAVFQKVGVRRQAELGAALAGLIGL